MDRLHWGHLLAKPLATVTRDSHMTVLALATLGGAIHIELFLSMLRRPRWPRQVISDCPVSLWHVAVTGVITPTFANGNTPYRTLSSSTILSYPQISDCGKKILINKRSSLTHQGIKVL
jgi:hypothetical protein